MKYHLKVITDSWKVLNEKQIESWRWAGESSGQEDETQQK